MGQVKAWPLTELIVHSCDGAAVVWEIRGPGASESQTGPEKITPGAPVCMKHTCSQAESAYGKRPEHMDVLIPHYCTGL